MPRKLSGPAIVAAVSSRKGGPGKSTLIGNLGVILTLMGFRVLLVEVDDNPYLFRVMVRGGGSTGSGGRRGELLDDANTTYRIFIEPGRAFLNAVCEIDLAAALTKVPHHGKDFMAQIVAQNGWGDAGVLHLIPGTQKLREVESDYAVKFAMDRSFDANFQLTAAFEGVVNDYDFILFDTPPSLAVIQRNVLAMCQYVFIPVLAKSTGIDDYDTTVEVIETVAGICKRRGFPMPRLLGAVVNMYQPRTPDGQPTVQETIYQQLFAEHANPETGRPEAALIEAPLLATVRYDLVANLDAAIAARYPVVIYAPKSPIAQDLLSFAQVFLARVGVRVPVLSN